MDANISKRQIKTSKVYFRASGLFHLLLELPKLSEVERHPKLGASWEGFVLEQIIAHFQLESESIFFWGTHAEAKIDLVCTLSRGRRVGFEIKYTDAPKVSLRATAKVAKLTTLLPRSEIYSASRFVHDLLFDIGSLIHDHRVRL